jgi:hypothetical protein
MATYVATNDIKWGKEDGVVQYFHDGDVVTGPTDAEIEYLVEIGSAVLKQDYKKGLSSEQIAADEAAAQELRDQNANLLAEVAKLKATLEAANKKPETPSSQK